ncbi:cytoplasmic protein [Kwoniella mangroviensis CBS 10435]|uniref:Cytoplasmic protein n=1 Tax=Kwoniella mangroviensis CBS 10435 TaxID=1331196 RepID=A0A1B9J1Z9_9TREE|nr:cytoplasmic protein [Kwoniella mangroviensis CBS 10435]
MSKATPVTEDIEEVLLSARYGEVDELKEFVEKFGAGPLAEAKDERGNTVLHMCCGNGHIDVLNYLLPLVPKELLSRTNEAGSPPLHWAVSNNHVACVKALVELSQEQGGGLLLLKQTNANKRDAFAESIFAGEGKEEVSGWIEGYLYKVEGGDDEEEPPKDAQMEEGEGEVKVIEGDDVLKEEAEKVEELVEKTEGVDIREN